jgi:hypothetical protein
VEKNLFNIDTLLGISDVNKSLNDGYESYLGAKHTSTKLQAENSYREASNAFNIFYTDWKIFRQDTDMTQLEKNALQLREVSTLTNKSLNYTIDTLQSSITSSTFPQNTLDTYISNFGNALSSLKNETAAFTLTLQTTQEAKTSMDVKIQSTNDLIANLKQKIKIGEATVQKTTLENEVSLALATQKVDQAQLTIDNARIKKDTSLVKEKSQIEISKGLLESKK